jgi:hypothetical protein
MVIGFLNFPAPESRTILGSARASRAVSGALAGSSQDTICSSVLAVLVEIATRKAGRRGRRAGHARRVRSPTL